MDEQLALLAIQSSLKHARELYEMLLYDKLTRDGWYRDRVGHGDILSALEKVGMRIKEIEET